MDFALEREVHMSAEAFRLERIIERDDGRWVEFRHIVTMPSGTIYAAPGSRIVRVEEWERERGPLPPLPVTTREDWEKECRAGPCVVGISWNNGDIAKLMENGDGTQR